MWRGHRRWRPKPAVELGLPLHVLVPGLAPHQDVGFEIVEHQITAIGEHCQNRVSVAVPLPDHRDQQRPRRPAFALQMRRFRDQVLAVAAVGG